MKHERIYLDPEHPEVYIDSYISDKCNPHDAMLVIPGGGYRNVCTEKEGEPIALSYVAEGYNSFVLNYRTSDEGIPYPAQLIDASRAIVHIRENADKYNINPDRVFAIGFSAGGHIAGSLAILASEPEVLEALGIKEGDNRPNAVVLAYPVVSALHPAHEPSFERLTGKPFAEISEGEKRKLSLECNVDGKSSPAFIWHTAHDITVPPYASLDLASAYLKAGVTTAMHLYPYGPHGIGLGTEVTAESHVHIQPLATGWFADSVKFLKSL